MTELEMMTARVAVLREALKRLRESGKHAGQSGWVATIQDALDVEDQAAEALLMDRTTTVAALHIVKVERDKLKARLDVAVEALTFYFECELDDYDGGHKARAALAKIT